MNTTVVKNISVSCNGSKLDELIAQATECLSRLNFKPNTIGLYQKYWRRFSRFCRDVGGTDRFSTEMVCAFLESTDTALDQHPIKCFQSRLLVSTRILTEVATTGGYHIRSRVKHLPELPAYWQKVLEAFQTFCREEQAVCEASVKRKARVVTRLIQFGLAHGIAEVSDISPSFIRDFMASHVWFKSATLSKLAHDLRSFVQHLALLGSVPAGLIKAVPTVRVYVQDRIPFTWKPEEVEKLLAAVDRASPRGKRDYAILLLAARLGIRSGDIRRLCLENFNWDASCIEFTQSKTQQPLTLPLSVEIGNAIIDYLKNGRPVSAQREVFLRAKAPHTPLLANNCMNNIIDSRRRSAGIISKLNGRHGFHSLRHSLASRLLETGTPIETIAAILGHTSIESTRVYAKIDIAMLRRAALDPEEARHE